MQGHQNDAFPIFGQWFYRAFYSSKKRKVRREFCTKQKGESAAATGRFVFFWSGCYLTFDSSKKRKVRCKCKEYKKTPTEVCLSQMRWGFIAV